MEKLTKICNACKIEKSSEEFAFKDKKRSYKDSVCKICRRVISKKWYEDNSEHHKEKSKERYKRSDKKRIQNKRWRKNNPTYTTEYAKKRSKEDPVYRINITLRSRIGMAIKLQYGSKAYKTIELLGCTADFAARYLESLFQLDMTWYNYGKGGWHIDHIIPCTAFDLTNPEEQRACFNYRNLQPMWESENIIKSGANKKDYTREKQEYIAKLIILGVLTIQKEAA